MVSSHFMLFATFLRHFVEGAGAFWVCECVWGRGGGGGQKLRISFHVFFAFYAICNIFRENKFLCGGGGGKNQVRVTTALLKPDHITIS